MTKISVVKGERADEIKQTEIIAEESGSLGDSKEARGFKRVKMSMSRQS